MNEELKRLSLMTMPQALKYRAETQSDRLALREKDFGVWRRTSWREYFEKARRFAIGLHALGFRAGDRLAVASDDTPEWLYADLAAQIVGVAGDVESHNRGVPAYRNHQRGEDAKQRGLSTAIRSQQPEEFGGMNVEGNTVKSGAVAITMHDILHRNHSGGESKVGFSAGHSIWSF